MSNSKKHSKKAWEEIAEQPTSEDLDEHPKTNADNLSLEHPSYEELEQKLTDAEKRAEKNWQDVLRTQAEMQNIQRRSKLDIENAHKFATEKLIRELVEVVDNLERSLVGFEDVPDNLAQVKAGVDLTLKMFLNVLVKFGVQQINPEGEPFNPTYHEAMSIQESAELPSNHVIKVLQKGYQLHDRLVRPAMVIVSK